MQQFSIEYMKSEVARREEGFRRAQRDGTVYEYPARRFRLQWPWRFDGPEPARQPRSIRNASA
jgi:hypothetical protein